MSSSISVSRARNRSDPMANHVPWMIGAMSWRGGSGGEAVGVGDFVVGVAVAEEADAAGAGGAGEGAGVAGGGEVGGEVGGGAGGGLVEGVRQRRRRPTPAAATPAPQSTPILTP